MAQRRCTGQWYRPLLAIVAATPACCGGPMIQTQTFDRALNSGKPLQGLSYFLPKALVPVTVSYGAAPTSAPSPKPSAATAMPGSSPAAVANAASTVTVNTGAPPKADSAPPSSVTVVVASPKLQPDPSQEYFLNYTRDAAADDTFGLHVDQSGLLATAAGESVDQTAAIIETVAKIAAEVATSGGSNLLSYREQSPKTTTCSVPKFSSTIEFDPDVRQSREFVSAKDSSQSVEVTLVGTGPSNGVTGQLGAAPEGPGILFREWTPWTITTTVTFSEGAVAACGPQLQKPVISNTNVLIPNGGRLFREDMSREALIDKKISLTVKSGMLVGVDVKRPSQLLALVKLPLTILSAPFGSIASAVSSSSAPSGTTGPVPQAADGSAPTPGH